MGSDINPFDLMGKTILVTGASSGIGRAVCIACARMGATICLTARNELRLEETEKMLSGDNHVLFPADLTLYENVVKLVSVLPDLDGIVHCVGIIDRVPCRLITEANIQTIFSPNFFSPVLLQSELLNRKKVKKASSIIFISSRAASIPAVGNAIYSASKGAILSYAKVLALELAPQLVRVNCICPAMVWTNLILKGVFSEDDFKEAQSKYPLKRYGQPEDVANLCLYLLSDASIWMTGSSIDLTGGSQSL